MKRYIQILVFIAGALPGKSNNVSISNIQIVNHGPDSTYIQFDLSWENSWRVLNGPGNYDGVWVFFKYRVSGGEWKHIYLNTVTTSDNIPTTLEYWRNLIGTVFYRSSSNIGTGTVSATSIRLTVMRALPADVEIKGFAIEMVYIPSLQTPLYIGDGTEDESSMNAFQSSGGNHYSRTSLLTSVDANSFDDSVIEYPNYFVVNGGNVDGFSLPFGEGDNDFWPSCSPIWCMKYEMTQGAYRDFLNTLTLAQQITRTTSSPTSPIGTGALTTSGDARNFLEIKYSSVNDYPAEYGCDANGNNSFDESDDGEAVACNFLSWMDVAAWLDWSGLAPMTEIHFEKICRGVTYAGNFPKLGEYAWGDTTINDAVLNVTDPFGPQEAVSNMSSTEGNAVCTHSSTNGPLRNGVFATSWSNRQNSGAGFYGVMDMSGNLTEPCVTIGNVAGRSYNKQGEDFPSGGDGSIDQDGNAIAYHWPGGASSASESTSFNSVVTNSHGTKLRGGDFSILLTFLRVSDRSDTAVPTSRSSYSGGRGVIIPAMYN